MTARAPSSYDPLRVLFWFELGFSQLIATVWTILGLGLWGWARPLDVSLPCALISGVLLGNGAYFLSKGIGSLERIRSTAPNPLLWPVLYTYGATFIGVAVLLTVFSHPPLLFLLGFSGLVLATPYIFAPIAVLTLHYALRYDVKELTAQIQNLARTSRV